jgi:hypothetical protein
MGMGAVMPGGDVRHSVNADLRSLVLRVWLEPDISPSLRVRVVEIGPGLNERPLVVTASVDDACRVVRRWLEARQSRDAGG